MPRSAKAKAMGDARERPFTPAMRDDCRRMLGRKQYASLVAQGLSQNHKIGLNHAYKLIDETREEVIRELTAQGGKDDPVTAQFLFLQSIVADDEQSARDRIAASQSIIKLLGLEKFLRKLDGDDVTKYLGELAAAAVARRAAQQPETPPAS